MEKRFVVVFVFINYCQASCDDENKYDDYTLLKIYPHNMDQLVSLAELRSEPYNGVEVLKRSHRVYDSTDILVSPDNVFSMLAFADTFGMPVDFKHNYGRFFHGEPSISRSFDVFDYNSYNSILDHIDFVAKDEPDLVTVQDMGLSYEGRKIPLVKISTDHSARKPIIFIEAGAQGRDWVGISMAMYLIEHFSVNKDSKELRAVDWYIIPVVNPDGYEYTLSSRRRRLWRKTRSLTKIANCVGVDASRNFAYQWGTAGASHDPCDEEAFCGPRPFSESETQIVRIALLENSRRVKVYLTLHSYGQYIMYPWGYTEQQLPWRESMRLYNLARMASDAGVSAGVGPFEVMSLGEVNVASGSSADYAYGTVEVPYVYSIALTEGFEYCFPKQLLSKVLPKYYQIFRTFSIQTGIEFGNTK